MSKNSKHGPAGVLMYVGMRYYRHIDLATLRQLADTWVPTCHVPPIEETFSEAARELFAEAGRHLYRISCDSGWRKLDARQRVRFGRSNKGAWMREDEYMVLLATDSSRPDVSDATKDYSSGQIPLAIIAIQDRMSDK